MDWIWYNKHSGYKLNQGYAVSGFIKKCFTKPTIYLNTSRHQCFLFMSLKSVKYKLCKKNSSSTVSNLSNRPLLFNKRNIYYLHSFHSHTSYLNLKEHLVSHHCMLKSTDQNWYIAVAQESFEAPARYNKYI